MKTYMKRLTAVLLSLALALTCLSGIVSDRNVTAAYAAEESSTKLTIGKISGTKKDSGKYTENCFEVESGSLEYEGMTDTGFKFTMNDEGENVRVRFKFDEGKGVKIEKGDYLAFKFDIENEFAFLGLYVEGLISDPDEWDSMELGNFSYTDGYALMEIPEDYFDNTLYALRIKGSEEMTDPGSSIIFEDIFILTDVTAPKPVSYNYTVDESINGISMTYYNDIYSRGFAWRTIGNKAKGSCLQYVRKDRVEDISTFDWDAGRKNGTVKSVADSFGKKLVNSDSAADVYYCHKAHIENLPDNTEWYYRVGCDKTGYSPIGTFKIDAKATDIHFIHVTDPQAEAAAEYEKYAAVLREAYKTSAGIEGSTLVGTVTTGDITNENHDGNYFIDEFAMAQDFDREDTMNSVVIPVAGNHDITEDVVFSMFDIDAANYCVCGEHDAHRTGICYSLEIGNVFVIATNSNESGYLNTDDPVRGEYDGKCDYHEQYNWIVEQLQKAQMLREQGKVQWVVVLTHAGMMSVGYHTMDGGSRALRANLVPLFAQYNVDIVLQGHDHAYTRTVPYYYGKDVNGNFFDGTVSNDRETTDGNGEITFDDPFTEIVETEGDRIWNVEPEGTHYITINYSGEKTLAISKDNPESNYRVPDACIEEGCAISPVNGSLCGAQVKKQFFGILRVKGDTMTYDTYSFNGMKSSLYDTFTVVKDGSGNPDIKKQTITFKNLFAQSKAYDGKAVKISVMDLRAMTINGKREVKKFREYKDLVYTVTGTLANGKEYTDIHRLPKEPGKYKLIVAVNDASLFYKGRASVEFEITE